MTASTLTAYQLIKNSTGGSEPLSVVYTERRVAELEAEKAEDEWVDFKVKEVSVREFNEFEGAVGNMLVRIDRTPLLNLLRQNAARKLTAEERIAVGL